LSHFIIFLSTPHFFRKKNFSLILFFFYPLPIFYQKLIFFSFSHFLPTPNFLPKKIKNIPNIILNNYFYLFLTAISAYILHLYFGFLTPI